ncbi:unnamed protein product [Somion occarium]|uniref:NAD-dependent epimerase/dehydratase domain-containing protein n=1 Tax=Somion occarium TaxID=3059160 RepID=A0ABP1DTE7_9APHY
MPAVQSGKVLVSGANGYVACWVIKSLLEQGYSVRGTVRSESKGAYTRKLFASYRDRFELVIVEDMCKEGAFDDAVKDVDGVQHIASAPVCWDANNPNDMIYQSMVPGVVSMLQSILHYGTRVKRVVITSSTTAVKDVPPSTTERVFTEENFNYSAIRELEQKGANTDPLVKYAAGKTLAELAAWELYEAEKRKGLYWDMVVIAPPFIFGPPLHHQGGPETLKVPMNGWYKHVLGGDVEYVPWTAATGGGDWVDVRDLSDAHVLVMQEEATGGHRFIISAGQFTWNDWIETVRRVSGSDNLPHEVDKPGYPIYLSKLDVSKVQRVLGASQYRDMEACTRALLDFFERKGWWES